MLNAALPPSWAVSNPISARLICLVTAASLTACSSMSTAPLPVAKVSAPIQCMESQSQLPLLSDPSMEGLLRHLVLIAGEWWDLKIKHDCLAAFERGR